VGFNLWSRVGYTRVILAGLSLHYMSTHPKYCTVLYAVSCLLDAVDGQAARALGQTSKFGAVLDMVTDRQVLFQRASPKIYNKLHFQLYYLMSPMFSILSLSELCHCLSVPHNPRLQQSLHAYVQVTGTFGFLWDTGADLRDSAP
jgi:CDP-alcohol phosphatidyltransferase